MIKRLLFVALLPLSCTASRPQAPAREVSGRMESAAPPGVTRAGGLSPVESPTTGDTLRQTIPGTDVGFTLVYVDGAAATIGTPQSEAGRQDDEPAPTTVALGPYWIAQTEVTFDEFAVFRFPDRDTGEMASGERYDVDGVARPSPPYEDPSAGMSRAGYPATGMTQWGALQYARWLSEKTGRFFRLPTEAEWEHACRLGGERTLESDAWYRANSGEHFHKVMTRQPDALGLYDMLGNVSEWTMDEYRADYAAFIAQNPTDPWLEPTSLHPRTVRGGAFDDAPEALRCGDRVESTLSWKRRDPQIPKSFWWNTDSPFLGFRLVSPVNQPTAEEAAAFWSLVLGD